MNNSEVGFSFQKAVCDIYNIKPNSDRAIKLFNASTKASYITEFTPIIKNIFNLLNSTPVECTLLDKLDGRDLPYNFVLSDSSTLSIRTNIGGDKVAPREVGQAGYEKLNKYFSKIYQAPIENQDDIKKLIIGHTVEVLPIFFEHLFDADYILWVYLENNKFQYELIKGDSFFDLDLKEEKFSFTRDYSKWKESTTLKYDNVSIAEVQVHSNRTFKFRFIMKNVLKFVKSKSINNETIGITAEKAICDLFGLEYPDNFKKRYSAKIQAAMEPVLKEVFNQLPKPIKHTGSMTGERGKASKCSYDFVLDGNKTLSLKTNIGKMVCPPEVGQPGGETCYLYFKDFILEDHIDREIFKRMVYDNIEKLIPIYIAHLFDSDFLLRLYDPKNNLKYLYQIVEKDYGLSVRWEKNEFSFSKPTIEDWNESNTLYYKGISIGEFQVHNHRNCYKFRFNFNNLLKYIQLVSK